jgi:hypothetical protein
VPHIKKLWQTKGKHEAVKEYFNSMPSLGKSISRAVATVERMAKEGNWGNPGNSAKL